MQNLRVKNSGYIMLQTFNDAEDGKLFIAEAKKTLPFEIKRFYFITDLSHRTKSRGKHAHKKLEQYIFCVKGSFDLVLDDGSEKETIELADPKFGVRLGAGLWHEMKNFSDDCVILVAADDYYDAADYIRDYAEFKKWAAAHK